MVLGDAIAVDNRLRRPPAATAFVLRRSANSGPRRGGRGNRDAEFHEALVSFLPVPFWQPACLAKPKLFEINFDILLKAVPYARFARVPMCRPAAVSRPPAHSVPPRLRRCSASPPPMIRRLGTVLPLFLCRSPHERAAARGAFFHEFRRSSPAKRGSPSLRKLESVLAIDAGPLGDAPSAVGAPRNQSEKASVAACNPNKWSLEVVPLRICTLVLEQAARCGKRSRGY